MEQFAAQTHFSKSVLSSYETEDLKDISHYALIKLTKFYEVTNDYLEIPTSSHRRKLRRNKVVRKSPFPSHLKPFNDSLVLSLKGILDKFPKTDILSFIHTDESLHVESVALLSREQGIKVFERLEINRFMNFGLDNYMIIFLKLVFKNISQIISRSTKQVSIFNNFLFALLVEIRKLLNTINIMKGLCQHFRYFDRSCQQYRWIKMIRQI